MIPAKRVTRSASAAAAAAAAADTVDTTSPAETVSKKLKTENKKPAVSKAAKAKKVLPAEEKNDVKTRKTRATKATSKTEEPTNQSPSKSPTPEKPVAAEASENQPTKSRTTRSTREVKKISGGNEPMPQSDIAQSIIEGSYLPNDLDPVVTDSGEEVLLQELAKSSGLIVFFYPRANTPGCTLQACGFRDRLPEAASQGYEIYGMSADTPKAQTSWKTKHQLGYTLLCDPEYKVLKRLGLTKQPKGIKRSHMVIEKGGRIKSLKVQIGPKPSVDQALATVTEDSG